MSVITIGFFADHGVRIERLITDNAFAYGRRRKLRQLLDGNGIAHKFIRPHCRWRNGKDERFNRTLATEWAYHHGFASNDERTAAFAPWIHTYNINVDTQHSTATHPVSRLPVTNLTAEYSYEGDPASERPRRAPDPARNTQSHH